VSHFQETIEARRRWIDCGTCIMERSPHMPPEHGLISLCLTRQEKHNFARYGRDPHFHKRSPEVPRLSIFRPQAVPVDR
jgi:hypothetical protein